MAGNWYCPTCARVVMPHEVTFTEFHDACGTYIANCFDPGVPMTDELHRKLVKESEGPNWVAGRAYVEMMEHAQRLERLLAHERRRTSGA